MIEEMPSLTLDGLRLAKEMREKERIRRIVGILVHASEAAARRTSWRPARLPDEGNLRSL